MKAVCLMSGGMDSTTLAYVAKDMGYDILALHMNYGQRTQRKELACARCVAERLDAVDCVEISLVYFTKFGASSLPVMSIPVEEGTMCRADHSNTYVPFRNVNLIAIAPAHAESR